MAKNEFHEDDEDLFDDEEGGGGGSEGSSKPAAKKTSLPVMAAIGLGVAAVVGFAGVQVYHTMSPSQPAQGESMNQQMAPVQPMVQQPAPLVPAANPAPVPAAAAAAAGGSAGSLAPMAASVGAPPEGASLAAADAAPAAPVAPAALGAGPVSPAGLEALAAMKTAQEAQAKRIDQIDSRMDQLEARLTELSAGRGVAGKAAKARTESADVPVEGVARKSGLHKERQKRVQGLTGKRAEEMRVHGSGSKLKGGKLKAHEKERLAKLMAEKNRHEKSKSVTDKRLHGSKTIVENKRRPARVVKSDDVMPKIPDAPAAKRPSVDLPPVPSFEPAKHEPKAEEAQSMARVSGLRIQAVIPGRAWISEGGGVARSYSVGDAIRSGVTIRAIDAEKGVVTTSAGVIR